MSRQAYTSVVRADLQATEHSIDAALAQAGQLLHSLTSGRAGSDFAAVVGHDALITLADGIKEGVAFRGRVVQTHSRLQEAAKGMKLPAAAYGPLEDKPDDGEPEEPRVTASVTA